MISISHLPLKWTEEDVTKLVYPFGAIEKCYLVRSKYLDGQSMGYAFLEFTSKASAIRVFLFKISFYNVCLDKK